MAYLLTFLLSGFTTFCLTSAINPIFNVQSTNDSTVVALLDIHKAPNANGSCGKLDTDALEIARGLVWKFTLASHGLLVYDTCGSDRQTLEILTQHFLDVGDCHGNNNTRTAGLMSYTSPGISDVISSFVRHVDIGILHMDIRQQFVSGDFEDTLSTTQFFVSLLSKRKLEAVFATLKMFDWTYVTVLTGDHPSSVSESQRFLRLARQRGVCVSANLSLADSSKLKQLDTTALVFASDSDANSLAMLQQGLLNNVSLLLVTSKYMPSSLKKILSLIGEYPVRQKLADDFSLLWNLPDLDSLTKEYFVMKHSCYRNSTTLVCNVDEVESYFLSRTMDRDMNVVLSSSDVVISVVKSMVTNCSSFDMKRCSDLLDNFVHSQKTWGSLQTSNGREMIETAFHISLIMEDEGARMKIGHFEDSFIAKNDTSLSVAKTHFRESTCMDSCDECTICSSSLAGDMPIFLQDGNVYHVYLGAAFPIHGTSEESTCGSLSWEGLQMAEAFMFAIRTFRDRYPSQHTATNVTFGGLVVDSCEDPSGGLFLLDEIAACSLKSDGSKLEEKLFGAYFRFLNNTRGPESPSRPIFDVSTSGVYVRGLQYEQYLAATVTLLGKMQWTYVSILYSDDEASLKLLDSLRTRLSNSSICIASVTKVVGANITAETVKNMFAEKPVNSNVAIFLTNYMDSIEIAKVVAKNHISFSHLILYPWNKGFLDKVSFAGAVLLEPKPVHHADFENYLNNLTVLGNMRNPWWKSFHEEKYSCSTDDIAFSNRCNNSSTVGSFEISSTTSYIIDAVDRAIIALGSLHKMLCPNADLCDSFKKETGKTSFLHNILGFTENGEMMITLAVINYQENQGDVVGIQVGEVTIDSTDVDPADIMAFDSRGTAYTARSECTGWCPTCYRCSGPLQYQNAYFYKPGDLIIGGMFPIHTKGAETLSCGRLALENHTDILVEAFLFAVKTAQTTYPGLLPNVSVGGLILDTCSDVDVFRQTLLNFESCQYNFPDAGLLTPSRDVVPGYVLHASGAGLSNSIKDFMRVGKLGLFVDRNGDITTGTTEYSEVKRSQAAIVDFLISMQWSYVSLISSNDMSSVASAAEFLHLASAKNICIAHRHNISRSNEAEMIKSIDELHGSYVSVVVLFGNTEDVGTLFRLLTSHPLHKTWILGESRTDWKVGIDLSLPRGTLVFDKTGKENAKFNDHLSKVKRYSFSESGNPWLHKFENARANCQADDCMTGHSSEDSLIIASDIIKAVYMTVHILHDVYAELCPAMDFLCQEFKEANSLTLRKIMNVSFSYQGRNIGFSPSQQTNSSYLIRNYQENGFVKIGEWDNVTIQVDREKIKSYGSNGVELSRLPDAQRYSWYKCINIKPEVKDKQESGGIRDTNPDHVYVTTTAQFVVELWTIIVVIVAGTGCLMTVLLMVYIMCKVCTGALVRRYLMLGLLLLVAVVFLFMSILPFLFTPGETVCGMRFFAHGFSYALIFAIVLTKMTTLRDYKYIGLGGEVSRINQILSVFFITGVQIAIGVQWWVLRKPSYLTEHVQNDVSGTWTTHYACAFDREEFVSYHSYVILLIVLSSLYSLGIRNETKNMNEAKLLLVFSWSCFVVWVAWIIVLFVLPRKIAELTISIEILVCASLVLIVIYLPKLTVIAKLKYEVSEKPKSRATENGYRRDSDFQFERPYSLPGTMQTSVTNKTLSYPRSLATFDTSLSY